MSQSEFALLGEAIAAGLNSGLDDMAEAAHTRKTAAELPTLTTDAWRVDVIQHAHETKPADRSSRFHHYTFDIVFRRRFDRQAAESSAIDPLCEVVELAEDAVHWLEIEINENPAECLTTRRDPPYDPAALDKGVFLAVITGTWIIQR